MPLALVVEAAMEAATDCLHTETETGAPLHGDGQQGEGEEDPGRVTGAESPPRPATQTDDSSACKICSVDDQPGHLPAGDDRPPKDDGLSVPTNPPDLDPGDPPEGLSAPAEIPPQAPRLSKASLAEMDCLVCFNRYGPCRPPKVLACQHAFCAVCLKLLLRHEERSWAISCPLCRKATVVFGGLICSLRDKEEVLNRLEGLALEADGAGPGPSLAGTSPTSLQPVSGTEDVAAVAGGMASRAAAKRLVLLLLLVAMIIVLVLPFLYTGLLKWALCSMVFLGLILSVVLCCNPRWGCGGPDACTWPQKESHVASDA